MSRRILLLFLLMLIPFTLYFPTSAQDEGCSIDLVLALDGSGSVAPQDFALMRTFVSDFVQSFPVGVGGANIGIIQFSDTAELYLPITQEIEDITAAIDHMTQFGNRTDIAGAITLAQQQFAVRREGIPRVIIILTDGMHNMGGNPIAQADIARANGTNILGIAVGSFNLDELIDISGGAGNVISVSSFQGLQVIIDTLLNTTCTAPLIPPAPNAVPTLGATLPPVNTPMPTQPGVVIAQSTGVPTATPAPGVGLATAAPATSTAPINSGLPGPRDTQIAFASDRDGDLEIFVMDGDGSNVRQLTFNDADDNKPSWSKDGRMIAWESEVDGDYEIWVMNADGTDQRQLTDNVTGDWGPAWSPDNSQLAFHSNRNGNTSIFTMNADGSNALQITHNGDTAIDQAATWSPDGQEIIYYSDKSGGREIYRINLTTAQEFRLTENEFYDGSPDWSFSGTQVVFGSARLGNNSEIWIMRDDGSDPQRLTDRPNVDDDPIWSPDSRQIAFESDSAGNFDIWIMNADGSSLRQLTTDPATDWSADWIWKP